MKDGSIHVFDLRSPVDEEKLPQSNARLGWREPLSAHELEAIARWARARGGASIRLYGAAVAQLEAVLDAVPVIALDIEAARIASVPRTAEHVRELAFNGLTDLAKRALASFSGVHTLRLDARGGNVDVNTLDALPNLRRCSIASASLHGCGGIQAARALLALELVRTRVDDADALLRHPGLVALRLANVERVTSLDGLRDHAVLRSLAMESLLHLESLAPIATLLGLESLAIVRLWQFNVGDACFIASMPGLRELSLDIGGERKNVEITKRLGLPQPAPFDVRDYDLRMSYESGVQRVPANLSSVTTVGAAGGFRSENGGV